VRGIQMPLVTKPTQARSKLVEMEDSGRLLAAHALNASPQPMRALSKLRRDPGGLQIVLEPKAPAAEPRKAKKPSRADAAVQKEKQELALILQQVQELLDEVPDTRAALRHLVFVEQALQKKGLRALHKLPLDVLKRALEQLEGLVTNWSPVGLANLRSKIAVAIIDREHMDPEAEADAYRTAAVLDNRPDPVPEPEPGPETSQVSDDEALAAAYAALGNMTPSAEVEFQGELGSRSARAVSAPLPRVTEHAGEIQLRELQS
jgi:hypothetical protein